MQVIISPPVVTTSPFMQRQQEETRKNISRGFRCITEKDCTRKQPLIYIYIYILPLFFASILMRRASRSGLKLKENHIMKKYILILNTYDE